MSHIGVGSGNRAAASTDTTLQTQLARVAAAYNHTDNTKAFSLESTFAAGTATGTVREAGVFNGSSGSAVMLNRVVLGAAVNKGAADTLIQTFTFTFS